MPIIVNHDGSFHAATQTAIHRAFEAAMEPLADGVTGPQAVYDAYKAALARQSADSGPVEERMIHGDLSDLYLEYAFPEAGTETYILQYFDGLGSLVYMIKREPA